MSTPLTDAVVLPIRQKNDLNYERLVKHAEKMERDRAKLVERVNRVAHWQPSADDERLAATTLDREIYEARALLREIGEDA